MTPREALEELTGLAYHLVKVGDEPGRDWPATNRRIAELAACLESALAAPRLPVLPPRTPHISPELLELTADAVCSDCPHPRACEHHGCYGPGSAPDEPSDMPSVVALPDVVRAAADRFDERPLHRASIEARVELAHRDLKPANEPTAEDLAQDPRDLIADAVFYLDKSRLARQVSPVLMARLRAHASSTYDADGNETARRVANEPTADAVVAELMAEARGPLDPASARHVWPSYRATDDEEGRRLAAGQTPTERIRAALALLAQQEDGR